MIAVTKLNRTEILLNSDLIEHVEETPDTVILLTNGHGLHVRESKEQVLQKVIEFRRAIGGQMNSYIHSISLKQGHPFHGQHTEEDEA
jgi:flagellar protein FlbD